VNLGQLLDIDVARSDNDSAIATMTADERHLNSGGTVHGGAIATLVDIAMGAAVFAGGDDDERPVTIEMKLNYLDAGKPGSMRAMASVRRRGNRFTVLEAEVTQGDTVVAFATGSFTTISASANRTRDCGPTARPIPLADDPVSRLSSTAGRRRTPRPLPLAGERVPRGSVADNGRCRVARTGAPGRAGA
jgi:uncharacterized protein (TIGR00369 family)